MKKIILFSVIILLSLGTYGQGKKITELPAVTSTVGTSLLMVRDGASGNNLSTITKANILSDVDDYITDTVDFETVGVLIGDVFPDLKALDALGCTEVRGRSIASIGDAASGLSDGRAYYQMVYVPEAGAITGLKFIQTTAGDYTADNNNYVALYSISGGTYTQVAISANNGNLWKAAANTVVTAAFATPYAAAAGVYAVGFIYNSSAQTAAPQIASSANASTMYSSLMADSNKLAAFVATQTTLPASVASSGTTISSASFFVILYE